MTQRLPVTVYPLWLASPLALAMVLFFVTPLLVLAFVSFYADPGMTQ